MCNIYIRTYWTHEFSWKSIGTYKKKKTGHRRVPNVIRVLMHVSRDGDGTHGVYFFLSRVSFILFHFSLRIFFFSTILTNSTLLQARSVIHDTRDWHWSTTRVIITPPPPHNTYNPRMDGQTLYRPTAIRKPIILRVISYILFV